MFASRSGFGPRGGCCYYQTGQQQPVLEREPELQRPRSLARSKEGLETRPSELSARVAKTDTAILNPRLDGELHLRPHAVEKEFVRLWLRDHHLVARGVVSQALFACSEPSLCLDGERGATSSRNLVEEKFLPAWRCWTSLTFP